MTVPGNRRSAAKIRRSSSEPSPQNPSLTVLGCLSFRRGAIEVREVAEGHNVRVVVDDRDLTPTHESGTMVRTCLLHDISVKSLFGSL